ncbi:MAG: adenosylmethionine--8-amino-7-oxononanoate transaminase [Planctomycetota bacterium]
MSDRMQQLAAKDKRYCWHPFTQMKDWLGEQPLIIERAEGATLYDTDGNAYIDGVSSLWCNIHGHRRPEIDHAIRRQLDRVAHSTMLGLSGPPPIELAERLVEITPAGLRKVFYSDSGSEAVEIALKIAFQYWRQAAGETRPLFVALDGAYHGDTIGSVSLGGMPLFHDVYRPLLFETLRAPCPHPYRSEYGPDPDRTRRGCLEAMDALLGEHAGEVAAVAVEPLVQGAAGILVHPPGYLSGVRELCDRHGVLLICDEVAVGFGRTGRMFACEHEAVRPDILAVGKGLTGGYLPLAVTLTTDRVYEAFLGEYEEFRTFFHGHTYTGNALACAAASASLDVFEKDGTLDRIQPRIEQLARRLEAFAELEHAGDVRQCGLIAAVELVCDPRTKEDYEPREKVGIRVTQAARERGLITRPLGNVIVIMPPLVIGEEALDRMLDILYESIRAVTVSV